MAGESISRLSRAVGEVGKAGEVIIYYQASLVKRTTRGKRTECDVRFCRKTRSIVRGEFLQVATYRKWSIKIARKGTANAWFE